MLLNPDGTPYQVSGSIQQFDPENPEFCLFNSLDAEMIQNYGSPIFYYEAKPQINTMDKFYREDKGMLRSENPIQLFALYDPVPSQFAIGTMGYDSPDEVVFKCNYQDVVQRIGHVPLPRSRIFTPHRKENWSVIQCKAAEFQMWNAIRMEILCKRFQEDVNDVKVTQKQPDFDINKINLNR